MIRYLEGPHGRLAYHHRRGHGPAVVFCGGFASTMDGIKATTLEAHALARGYPFVRFDYTGHGASQGRFENGTVGVWAADTRAVLDRVVPGPVVLVGSSLGAWVAALVVGAVPERVRGLVTVAAAPDFTEDLLLPSLGPAGRRDLDEKGHVLWANPHLDTPTIITRALIEDGRAHRVLDGTIALEGPARLIHGLADAEVPWGASVRLAEALTSDDVRLTLVKGADHRMSDPRSLTLLTAAVDEVVDEAGGRRQETGNRKQETGDG